MPSTRIACLNLFDLMAAHGLDPVVLFEPAGPQPEPDVDGVVSRALAEGCDVVVFQKVRGASVLRCVAQLREKGVPSVYVVCDIVDDAMAAAAERTMTVTTYLRSLYAAALQPRIDVVHDGIERPDLVRPGASTSTARGLRAALVTSQPMYALPVMGVPPAPWRVEVVGLYAGDARQRRRALRWALMSEPSLLGRWRMARAALHPRLQRTRWTPGGAYRALLDADVGIIPINRDDGSLDATAPVPAWQVKSENRLTLKMALCLPVVATPIPAYEAVLQHGVNGFFAATRSDWLRCLAMLRDPALRNEMGHRARASVLDSFSVQRQAELFVRSIQQACLRPGAAMSLAADELG